MKMKQFFYAALSMATAFSAAAATQNAMMPAPATPAAPAMSTNSNSDAMTALFGDPVIAKGKGFEIKQSQLDEVMSGIKSEAAAHGQQLTPAQLKGLEARFLDRLIQIRLLLQKSTDADRAEGKKKADEQLDALLKRAGSKEKFDLQLKAVGISESELRKKITEEMTANATLQREVGVTVSDSEAKDYYTNHPADFEEPETVHVRHILLLTIDPETQQPLDKDQVAAKHKQIEEILKRARAGEDFAKLAEQYSEDPGSKDDGGELPPFDKDGAIPGSQARMVPAFTAAAFSLTNNQISDVVETQYGYHIIKLLDRTPASKVAYSTIADRLKFALAQKKMQPLVPPYLETLTKSANVEILDPELKEAMSELTNAPSQAEPVPAEPVPAK